MRVTFILPGVKFRGDDPSRPYELPLPPPAPLSPLLGADMHAARNQTVAAIRARKRGLCALIPVWEGFEEGAAECVFMGACVMLMLFMSVLFYCVCDFVYEGMKEGCVAWCLARVWRMTLTVCDRF